MSGLGVGQSPVPYCWCAWSVAGQATLATAGAHKGKPSTIVQRQVGGIFTTAVSLSPTMLNLPGRSGREKAAAGMTCSGEVLLEAVHNYHSPK
jgi:hypothetical protein